MPIDDAFIVILEVGAGAITSLVGIGIAWGSMKNSLRNFEKRMDELQERQSEAEDKFVTQTQFEGILQPIQQQMSEIRTDIKSILRQVSTNPVKKFRD